MGEGRFGHRCGVVGGVSGRPERRQLGEHQGRQFDLKAIERSIGITLRMADHRLANDLQEGLGLVTGHFSFA